jgi:hypothetical protein
VNRGRLLALGVAAALTGAGGSASTAPRSAIPWLSESIEVERNPPPRRPDEAARPPVPGTEVITVTPLGAINREAVGLFSAAAVGLPRNLWGDAPAAEVSTAILEQPDPSLPAAQDLFRTLLLVESSPPPGGDAGAPVLLARIDRLLAMGALEDAAALIERAGPDAPELFRRWFDIGILTSDAEPPCEALRQNPALSPTLPARVFCLARGGDWNAAEITLTLGEEIGAIGAEQQPLLARFLDPQLFEEADEPPIPDPLTPLDFLMREAVGLSRPSGALPVAFLHHDLEPHAPMRSRIAAAERLWRAGGIDATALLAAYRSGTPAASGGVWDRAAAVQALDAALAGEGGAVGPALLAAEAALDERGLSVALAQAYVDDLAALDPAALDAPARAAAFRMLLLAGAPREAAEVAPDPQTPGIATLLAVAGEAARARPETDLERAAVAALGRYPARGDTDARAVRLLATGRTGEAILAALRTLGAGGAGGAVDPAAFGTALGVLRRAGQDAAARRIAVQILLADRDA